MGDVFVGTRSQGSDARVITAASMRRQHIQLLMAALMTGGALAGCGGGGPSPADNAAALVTDMMPNAPSGLTDAEQKLVEQTVRGMIDDAADATFIAITKNTRDGAEGTDVCGYVKAATLAGETRFYVELRAGPDGAPKAHRGQVGTDEAKRAKVAFVCRHNAA